MTNIASHAGCVSTRSLPARAVMLVSVAGHWCRQADDTRGLVVSGATPAGVAVPR